MANNKQQQEDLHKLLIEYDATGTDEWITTSREPSCSKSALRRSLVVCFVLLVAVTVTWFLHVNVFMGGDSRTPAATQMSVLSVFGGTGNSGQPVGFMDTVLMVAKQNDVNLTAIVEYSMKHMPPTLSARILAHVNDIQTGDFMKLIQDVKLIDELLDYLQVPDDDDMSGGDNYDYDYYYGEKTAKRKLLSGKSQARLSGDQTNTKQLEPEVSRLVHVQSLQAPPIPLQQKQPNSAPEHRRPLQRIKRRLRNSRANSQKK